MTTSIGGVTLTNDMPFPDQFSRGQVHAEVEDTLGGGVVVQEFVRTDKGREITLTTLNGMGYQLLTVVEALEALAAVPNASYALSISHNSKTFTKTVRFRNEEDGGPVQFTQIGGVMDGLPTDAAYMEGSIFLMEV